MTAEKVDMGLARSVLDVVVFLLTAGYLILKAIYESFLPSTYQPKKDIRGEIALVTGGGGGLGRLVALRLAKLGATVVLWDINEKGVEETVELVKGIGGKAYGFKCDIADTKAVYSVAKQTQKEVGDVTILINNAGVVSGQLLLDTPDHLIKRTFDVNIIAHFWTVKAFLPKMIERDQGHIVTVASMAGYVGVSKLVDYCSSKFAAVGFDEALRVELEQQGIKGIKTTVVCPYFIQQTGMFENVSSRFFPTLQSNQVADRIVEALVRGTSSARFAIFKAGTAEIVASHQQELVKVYPQEGWVEQDPVEILTVVRTCIEKAIDKLIAEGGNVNDIAAVGITNQRESTILWDKITGKPLYNSIVWQDVRTSSTVEQLLDTVPNKSRNKNYLKPLCGLPLSPYFSALKIKWLYDNIPHIKKAIDSGTCLFGNIDSWIIWNLTGGPNGGVHATDVTNASRTMLMNIDSLKWDPVLLQFFGIKPTILPQIKSSSEVYGIISEGSLSGVKLAGCLGDQQSALVGQQCLNKGQAKATYGTGCFLLYNTGNLKVHSSHGLLTTVAYQFGSDAPPVYALEGSVAVAGAAINWLRDNLGILPSFFDAQEIAEKADSVKTGEVYFVPAFSGLYAPYWQQEARGVIVGIAEDTDTSHIVRATLEAVCYQTRDILEAMSSDYGGLLSSLQVDGGMTANPLLMQLQADLAGITVVRPEMAECTALGAAMAAGAAVGCWDVGKPLKLPCIKYSPKMTSDERDVKYSKWKMAIDCATGWNV